MRFCLFVLRAYFDGGVAGFAGASAEGVAGGGGVAGADAGGGVAGADAGGGVAGAVAGGGVGFGAGGGVGLGAAFAGGAGGLSEMLTSSTSKTRFVFAGIFGGLPGMP